MEDWDEDYLEPDTKKEKGPSREEYLSNFANLIQVKRDLKQMTKGDRWHTTGKEMTNAKAEMKLERESSYVAVTRKEWNRTKLAKAKDFAKALVREINNSELFKAFEAANARMNDNEELRTQLEKLTEQFEEETDPSRLELLYAEIEKLETEFYGNEDYQTCADKGERQAQYLKALDFTNLLTPGMRLFNVCRAKTGCNDEGAACACGLAFVDKMWSQPNKAKWVCYCKVDWEQLVLAGDHFPENRDVQEWVRNMKNKHGEDWKAWPEI